MGTGGVLNASNEFPALGTVQAPCVAPVGPSPSSLRWRYERTPGRLWMTRDELLARLAGLRQARVGQVRVPHKPLLLLWLFGQFAATGSSEASYQQAEEPVSQLINDFGPPVASAAAARQRAAMPFVHLERELWDLRDATGNEIAPDAPKRNSLSHGDVASA